MVPQIQMYASNFESKLNFTSIHGKEIGNVYGD